MWSVMSAAKMPPKEQTEEAVLAEGTKLFVQCDVLKRDNIILHFFFFSKA